MSGTWPTLPGTELFDSLGDSAAVLDQRGRILAVNVLWTRFAHANGLPADTDFLQANYLAVCDRARGPFGEEAPLAAAGIRDVLAGRSPQFTLQYPCHSPADQRWFQMRVVLLSRNGTPAAFVSHRDVTRCVLAQAEVQAAQRQLMFAREEDMRRVACEIHDNACQYLGALHLMIEQATRAGDRPDCAHLIREAGPLCDQAMQAVRSLSHVLHPPALDSEGLVPAITRMLALRPVVTTRLHHPPDLDKLRFSDEVEIALFRIAQEAVSNAVRHGKARRIVVRLDYRGGRLRIAILDDGVGFDPAGPASHGLGLASMRQRARAVSGELAIKSRPGQTQVTVTVPTQPRSTNSPP